MATLTDRLGALTPERRALLSRRLQASKKPGDIARLPRLAGQPLPTSFSQQRLWFLHQLDPRSSLYNTFVAVRISGALDHAALEATFREIQRRHEVLRAIFLAGDNGPVQLIQPDAPVRIPVVDLQAVSARQRDQVALALVEQEVRRPFDIGAGPVLRQLILRLGPEDQILALTMHHIVSDRWSIQLLIGELAALYDAFSRGEAPSLPELPIQYADYAAWQRERLAGPLLDEHLAYWRLQLQGPLPDLDLPFDHKRSSTPSSNGARLSAALPDTLVEQLASLGQHHGATLFMTMLALFKLLLYRFSGQPDIRVGSPIANRPSVATHGLIGFFLNTLVLRTRLQPELTFAELLERVRTTCLDAYAHQELPFERLVEALHPERSALPNPLFQVMFTLNDLHDPMQGRQLLDRKLKSNNLTLAPALVENGAVASDLILHVERRPGGSTCALEYNTALFERASVERMLASLLELAAAAVRDPELPLAQLPCLPEAERRRVIVERNATAAAYPRERGVHLLFSEQARRTPEAIAAVFGPAQVTYRELDESSNHLAHYLMRCKVRRGARVGICLDRSLDMVVAMLATLKTGAAYVPVDPAFPRSRIAYMLEDASAAVVILTSRDLDAAPAQCQPVCLDRDLPDIQRESASDCAVAVSGDDLAYVIYTSGSTGRPKGVAVAHRGVARLVLNTGYVQLGPGDRIAQVSNPSFDAVTFEIWGALLTGACLIGIAKEVALEPRAFTDEIRAQGVNTIFLTTALFNLIARERPDAFAGMRYVLFGGEACDPPSVSRVLAAPPHHLLHMYGPTESTTYATWHPVLTSTAGAHSIPIGLPIANTTAYVLNSHLEPVPERVAGELHLGGDGLARGYLNQPALTAGRFVPDPFSLAVGARLYRTGDLVKYTDGGAIEFIGRADHQVKLRGFRIELGEIESALQRHPAVRQSVVVVREDTPGDQRLAAYVSAAPDSVSAAELRAFLASELPGYMTPSAVTVLQALPLNASGKVDRQALPAPSYEQPGSAQFVAPSTPGEQMVAAIWCELLHLERVSAGASFFELGGHSLLATQVMARVRETFQVDAPLRLLFEDPTVAGFAARIAALIGRDSSRAQFALPEVRLAPQDRYLRFPLTEVQQAYWLGRTAEFDLGSVSSHGYLELEVAGLDIERLQSAVQGLIERHDMLRAVIHPDGYQQVLESVPAYRLPVLDLRQATAAERERRLSELRECLSHQVMPSDRWPLFDFRATLLPQDRVRLHVGTDALIGDAWSWRILSSDLAALYESRQAALPALDLTFRDYVLAGEALRGTPAYERSLDYWRGRIPELPPAPELPVASRPPGPSRFVRRSGKLHRGQWAALKSRAVRHGLTPSAVAMAAFAEVLAAWSKSGRFTLNLTLFNRLPLHPQVDQIAGDFTSLSLLAVEHDLALPFAGRARRIQAQLWDDLDHRYVGGVHVMRELARAAAPARVSFPVVFTSLLNLDMSSGGKPVGELIYSISQTPQVWLDHQVWEKDGDLCFNWDAVEGVFPAGVLDAMFGAFTYLLGALAEGEEIWTARQIQLTPAADLEHRVAANATSAPVSQALLHELFLEQARERDQQPAVISPAATLTYAQLQLVEHSVALRVRELGAQPGELVAVVMDKGWQQVAAVAGILEAGAAYLPIDAALPPDRIEYLLVNGDVRTVVTQPWIEERMVWPERIARVVVRPDDASGAAVAGPLPRRPDHQDLAYVIYTSGSTGSPKGVMIDHRGAVNTVLDVNERFGVSSRDRVLALSSLSFDLSVYDIFGALAAGGAIVIPDPAVSRDPAHWLGLLQQHRVTIWNSVPALMSMLVEHLAERGLKFPDTLRLVLLSGDWIPVGLPDQIRALGSNVEVISLGGATEASIWSILYPVGPRDPSWRSIPYGRPMRNQTFHVLDDALQPRPVWVPGELYIGGIGVAKGYWRDQEKTAAKFVVHPRTGERLYRTGDLGRYIEGGVIEFLGREDFQVKIQGYRIELGEIETFLNQHPGVRESVVNAVPAASGGKQLVAYVVPAVPGDSGAALSGAEPASPRELREFLERRLPEYMVPAAFLPIPAIPLTANGKVDRGALPKPSQLAPGKPQRVAPATPTEELLAGLWRDVLGVEHIGMEDDFFLLGGHSMLATRLVTQIRELFNVELPLRTVFEASTVAAMAARIEAKQRAGDNQLKAIAPVSRDQALPLSFAQQRLWFLDQLYPDSPAYNMPTVVRLTGRLDTAALIRTLNEIWRRHESMRTIFPSAGGKPVQCILPFSPLDVPLVDLSSLEASVGQTETGRLVAKEARRPFELSVGPLFRAVLIRTSAANHLLCLNSHHIIFDGWSLGVLLRETAVLYEAFRQGQASPLPELPIQYADFSVWQREWLRGADFENRLEYWRTQMSGAPEVLELPADEPRPAVQSYRGGKLPIRIPAGLTAGLKRLAQGQRATMYMVLLAAFQSLLSRMTGQLDIVVGSPVANRNLDQIEGLIGFFANTVVLRTRLGGDPSFSELLARVRATALEAFARQDVPLERLVEELQPERALSHSPLFQVMFAFQNTPYESVRLPELEIAHVEADSGTVHFDLTLRMWEERDELAGSLEYNADIFHEESMHLLERRFETLLGAVGAEPGCPVSQLPMMEAGERTRILSEWNDTARDYPQPRPIQDLVWERAAATPEATAIMCGGARLCWRELRENARRIAAHLRARGVRRGSRVGVALPRSAELAATLLGVLEAGAAWAPVDPAWPRERIEYVLRDAGVSLLIDPAILCEMSAALALPADAPQLSPGDIAYLIHTSGSTGQPKGAMITHGALWNYVHAMGEALAVTSADVYLHTASFSFSSSVRQLLLPLAQGATVVIAGAEDIADPLKLFRLARERGVTVMDLVPSYWRSCLISLADLDETARNELLDNRLRLIATASEPLPQDLTQKWTSWQADRVRLLNMYGQTETAGIVATYPIPAGAPGRGVITPVGRPIGNTRIYLLDALLRPVPAGAAGAIYVGGAGLGLGYLNRPQLTAEKFVPDPFGGVCGGRLYNTGDLGRYRSDGVIEFRERADRQVKIRGFRVELGEVEAALCAHENVREAAVLALPDAAGYQSLGAVVVARNNSRNDSALNEAALRAFLHSKLPDYMVPACIEFRDALPRTSSGKLERNALRLAAQTRGAGRGEYAEPVTATEQALAAIWAEVLNRPNPGIHDNFFALGGHSLIATQVMSRIRTELGVELPLRTIFEASTIAQMAGRIEAARNHITGSAETAPRIVAAPRDGELPLSFAQQRLWFLHQFDPQSSAYAVPGAVRMTGRLDVPALERALAEVIRRHEILRTTFHSDGGRPFQVVSPPGPFAFTRIDLTDRAEPDRERELRASAEAEIHRPFDLSRDRLLRATLVRLGQDEHVLMLVMHHIVSDGWSTGVLVREMAALYQAFSAGAESPLPELAIQYADYARWQRDWLRGEVLEEQLRYWRGQLGGVCAPLDLPVDSARPASESCSGATVSLLFTPELGQAIESFSRSENATLFMTLLAAFQALLFRYSGANLITVGTPIAGRNRRETEDLLGCFVNTLALRTGISGELSFRDLVQRVRNTVLGAYDHQDLPFEQLVEELQPERVLNRTPLFQAMFVLQNAPVRPIQLPGLMLRPVELPSGTAKFDLTLGIGETPRGLAVTMEYNRDIFNQSTVARMLDHYRSLLQAAMQDPEQPCSSLEIASQADRRLIESVSGVATCYPRDLCVHQIFDLQALRRPAAIALESGSQRMSYGELEHAANQLAHWLRSRGVGPEVPVAVCLERGLNAIVVLLAIVKAGGVYVPLEPENPAERLRAILAGAAPQLVLTEQNLVDRLPIQDAPVVSLEAIREEVSRQPATAFDARVTPDNLIYIMYTSGSTGTPKGVAVTHRGVVRLVKETNYAELGPRETLLQYAPLSFDASTFEIWGALLNGARLAVFPPYTASLAELAGALEQYGVTTLWLTAGLFHLMVEEQAEALSRLRQLIAGGDVLSTAHVRRLLSEAPGCRFINGYGPTENTTFTACHTVTKDDLDLSAPIGSAIANTRVYVLDSSFNPVPPGAIGELWTAGDGLARGYLNCPELTAERFLPDPFSREPGARMYRTADLARLRGDGVLLFVGRRDRQVKVRGFRVEPREIEMALQRHEQVRDAVVTVLPDRVGTKRLVAYITVAGDAPAPAPADLRQWLRRHLAEYMIPSAFVVLDRLPLNANGKVDRAALPSPVNETEENQFEPPRTPLEEALADIWIDVLGIDRIGRDTNFFEAGGHSLLATRIVARVEEKFLVQLPLRLLFETPTVAGLAECIEVARWMAQGGVLEQ